MFEPQTKEDLRLCFWPSPQDYNEAVQNLTVNASDAELSQGLVYLDALGLPRPVTGSFASVYRLKCDMRDVALRCFLHNIADQQERYVEISRYVQHDSLPYTLMFDFLPFGINVSGSWFPALKMEWVEGEPLDRYMAHQLTHPEKVEHLPQEFLKMMNDLRAAGIAHGDLQHGNILVLETGELRLVDYDGMFVPAMQNMKANELGHRNYQHPQRNIEHFGPYIDNFSAWVIYASIVGLQIDPKLWHQLAAGDDCLLFRQSDFLDPLHSPAFAAMELHPDSQLQSLGLFLRAQIANAPQAVQYLQFPVPLVKNISPLVAISPIRKGPRVINPGLPEWLTEENVNVLSTAETAEQHPQTNHYVAPPPIKWSMPAAPQPPASAKAAVSAAGNHSFEPELLQPIPRAVEYNSEHAVLSPGVLQVLMMCNPAVWIAVWYLCLACGPDWDLMQHGRDYTATVINGHPYDVSSKSGKYTYQYIDYQYNVNGREYFNSADGLPPGTPSTATGDKFTVHALPSRPAYIEPIFAPAGTRFGQDIGGVCFGSFFTVIFELWIWISAMRQKMFVVSGELAEAAVISKTTLKRSSYYRLRIQYSSKTGQQVSGLVLVSGDDFQKYKVGDVLTVLYDPDYADSFVIYKQCRYRAVAATPTP